MTTVWVAGHKTATDRVYHEDAECRFVTESHSEWDKDTAEGWDIEPCKYCSPELEPDSEPYDRSLNQKLRAMGREYEQTGKDPLQQS